MGVAEHLRARITELESTLAKMRGLAERAAGSSGYGNNEVLDIILELIGADEQARLDRVCLWILQEVGSNIWSTLHDHRYFQAIRWKARYAKMTTHLSEYEGDSIRKFNKIVMRRAFDKRQRVDWAARVTAWAKGEAREVLIDMIGIYLGLDRAQRKRFSREVKKSPHW